MGGITNTRAFASHYGPHGLGVPLAGLYDAPDAAKLRHGLTAAGLGAPLALKGLPALGFFACSADLEDELIRALGVQAVEAVIEAAGEAKSLRLLAGMPAQRGWYPRRGAPALPRGSFRPQGPLCGPAGRRSGARSGAPTRWPLCSRTSDRTEPQRAGPGPASAYRDASPAARRNDARMPDFTRTSCSSTSASFVAWWTERSLSTPAPAPLRSSGSSNALFRLGNDLLVRLPRQPGGGATIEKESALAALRRPARHRRRADDPGSRRTGPGATASGGPSPPGSTAPSRRLVRHGGSSGTPAALAKDLAQFVAELEPFRSRPRLRAMSRCRGIGECRSRAWTPSSGLRRAVPQPRPGHRHRRGPLRVWDRAVDASRSAELSCRLVPRRPVARGTCCPAPQRAWRPC